MRTLLFTFIGFISIAAIAQQEVVLRFDHMVDNEPLVLKAEYTEPGQGYDFSITRLQYYVAEIEITHDGGQKTMIENTWLLVTAPEETDFDLGSHNINSVEAISYWVGVDPDHNHLDPTQYETGHPLAPKNPPMHWGWAAGYRFVCLEGKTGMNLILTYQIHALGDDNYFQVKLETGGYMEEGKLVIPLLADYMGMYRDIDISDGTIEHGEEGYAITLLENFSDNVYSAVYFTDVVENEFEGAFNIGPNPATNGLSKARLQLPSGNDYSLKVMDLNGRMIQNHKLIGGNHILNLEPGQAGVYFVQLSQNGSPVVTEKLIVTQ